MTRFDFAASAPSTGPSPTSGHRIPAGHEPIVVPAQVLARGRGVGGAACESVFRSECASYDPRDSVLCY